MVDAYGFDSTIDREELTNIIKERTEEAIQINKSIGLEASEAIIEYDFDITFQIEFNKKKNKKDEVMIQGYQDNTLTEILDINRLFNSNKIK